MAPASLPFPRCVLAVLLGSLRLGVIAGEGAAGFVFVMVTDP